MWIVDRYILTRFAINYLLLFGLLFLFAASIDIIVNLDDFAQISAEEAGADESGLDRITRMIGLMVSFQSPRFFVFFAYMHGLVAIGAMAFSLAQMHRQRELLALLASGISLHRLAVPFMAAMLGISLVQLLNQEFMLYRVAPLVIRSYSEAGQRTVDEFPITFVEDRNGNLLQAATFEPVTGRLAWLTILERDELGRTTRRLTADEAMWDEIQQAWVLEGGRATHLPTPGTDITEQEMSEQSVRLYSTDLSPRYLTGRQYGQYIAMLSLRQIDQMLETPRPETKTLLRHRYARFATIFVNLLVLAISLPSFLLREPSNLMMQSLNCAAMALPALMGAVIGMTMDLPGIPPAVGAFLPVAILIPVAIARWTFLKT